jgi:hypothetical protein
MKPAAIIVRVLRRLPTTIPAVTKCSLAIVAACHDLDNMLQPDASMFLSNGVLCGHREGSGWELTSHCGWSQYLVKKPQYELFNGIFHS